MLLIAYNRPLELESPRAVQPANSLGGAKGSAVIPARLLGAAQLNHPRIQGRGICQGHRARMVHGWVGQGAASQPLHSVQWDSLEFSACQANLGHCLGASKH